MWPYLYVHYLASKVIILQYNYEKYPMKDAMHQHVELNVQCVNQIVANSPNIGGILLPLFHVLPDTTKAATF